MTTDQAWRAERRAAALRGEFPSPFDLAAPEFAPPGTLGGLAQEINARFALADKADAKAGEHRLAAALQLAKAKEQCLAEGVQFLAWADANVSQCRRTVLAMVAVGSAPDPRQALDDLRARNAQANRALRERKALSAAAAPERAAAGPAAAAPTAAPEQAQQPLRGFEEVRRLLQEFEALPGPAKRAFLEAVAGLRRGRAA